jgi:ferredoxin
MRRYLWARLAGRRWLRGHADQLTGDRTKPLRVTWVMSNGAERIVTAFDGQTLLEVAMEHDLPVEGACAGSCACSTCHVYLCEKDMKLFPEPSDEENDMLDMAFFPQPTSRLGCQLKLNSRTMDGLRVELPKATRNMAVDGYVSKPH